MQNGLKNKSTKMHFYPRFNFLSSASINTTGLIITAGSLFIAWVFLIEIIFFPEYLTPLSVALFFIFSIGIPAIYFGITAILDFTTPGEIFPSTHHQKISLPLDECTLILHPEIDQRHGPRTL